MRVDTLELKYDPRNIFAHADNDCFCSLSVLFCLIVVFVFFFQNFYANLLQRRGFFCVCKIESS